MFSQRLVLKSGLSRLMDDGIVPSLVASVGWTLIVDLIVPSGLASSLTLLILLFAVARVWTSLKEIRGDSSSLILSRGNKDGGGD